MKAQNINTDIVIHSGPDRIWGIISDFENYPNWNPCIKSIKGNVREGNIIKVRIEPPDGHGMSFSPKVLAVETNRRISWIGRFLFSGMFDGEHTLELVDNGDGTTTFIQREKFQGILTPLFNLNATMRGFKAMNEKLKELVEN
jgi:hypothetical protein